jgi:GT2 family glycosyltransferase/glycosyltransferase involved in cell wall biosynthesis
VPALFASYSGLLGGAERVLLDVAVALDETPALACPEGALAERARAAGLHVLALSERPLELRGGAGRRAAAAAHLAAFRHDVRGVVGALRPDVVVAWGMRAGLACAGLDARVVLQHHDLLPGPVIGRALRAAARRADAVVAVSECVASELGVPATVIHPGVDVERLASLPDPPEGSAEVLVLGAITRWKRPELALEVFARASRERPELRLRIAGTAIGADGESLLEELQRRASRPDLAGRVEIAGSVDTAAALARASCLLHCADREPYGLVLVEAMAAGRPVVAPASCGPLEIADQTCARLYPPGDADAAADALVEALDNAGPLGAAGRERAREHFERPEMQQRYIDLLRHTTPGTRQRTPDARPPQIALLTVTHNSRTHLPLLLASAHRHLPHARILVVDSGSTDTSARIARDAGATVIELEENVGFGRACNAGLRQVTEPVTVLVNPDVELLDDSLAALAHELESGPERILAPLVLRPDGSREDSAQGEPGSAGALAIALVPPALMPGPLRRAACPWTAAEPRRSAWAVGACLAARTETLRKLGPFDERAFMYAEDLDLGLRAADAGIETWFRPDARVLHHGAHSTEPAFGGEPFELLAQRRRSVIEERRGKSRRRIDDVLQALTFANRIALKQLARRDAGRERRQLAALRKGRR